MISFSRVWILTLLCICLKDFPVQCSQINVVIDLSHWNGNVNLKSAKQDGIEGVIHKATQGLTNVDSAYATNKKAAAAEGLLWGAYHFGTGADGKQQADHFLTTVGDTTNTLLVLDIEENTSGTNMEPAQADAFVNRIVEVTKRHPMIYGSASFLNKFATATLTKCPLWIARYGASPTLPTGWEKWVLWQYTDGTNGATPHEVKGIGKCDRDKFDGTLQQLKTFWTSGN